MGGRQEETRTIARRVRGEGRELRVQLLRVERVLLLEIGRRSLGERREGEEDESRELGREHRELG